MSRFRRYSAKRRRRSLEKLAGSRAGLHSNYRKFRNHYVDKNNIRRRAAKDTGIVSIPLIVGVVAIWYFFMRNKTE